MSFTDHIDRTLFDVSVPVSDDFYRHVNGGWLDANPVPSEYPAWGSFLEVHVRNEEILKEILEEAASTTTSEDPVSLMVGDYFAAGMDEEAIAAGEVDTLRPLLDRIDVIETTPDLVEVLLDLQRVGVGAFHSLSISPDFEDAGVYLVYVGQGGLGLPERDYYLRDDERSHALVAAYTEHVSTQLTNLGGDEEMTGPAADIVALERRLASVSHPAEKMRDMKLTLNRYRVEDLDDLAPGLGLTDYVRRLGTTTETVSVDNPGFFEELDRVISETSMTTLRHYLRWHLIRRYASSLPSRFEDAAFHFYGKTLGGQQEQRPRWTRVLAAATADIAEQVSRLFVDRTFSPEAKERCELMVGHLIEAMERSIRRLDWMTDDTREAALTKLGYFTYKIGYPDVWRDYTGLAVDRRSYSSNRMSAAVFEYERQFGRLEESVDRGEWAMPAHIVNAYYNPLLNEIVFPAGILQPPFFHADGDDAVVYGGIGAVIGHEITHGFDDRGSQFDENGGFRNWWTEEDRTEFERRADVLAEQFSAYEVAGDQKLNGRLTLGENIADLGGVAIAYDAFLQVLDEDDPGLGGFNPRERFFLAYATIWRMNYTEEYLRMLANIDTHSPNGFRVNGPLSNFIPFAEVFAVEEGTPMRRSPGDLVAIW